MPTWLIFILLLSVLVLVHEFGHFMAARILGIKVEEFAMGLPFTPPLGKIKRGETQYAIYPILFGGFVRLHGEEDEGRETARSFWNRGKKQRLMVITAGVVMNLVLALTAFLVLYGAVGVPVRQQELVTVELVKDNSPAQKAGLAVGERIVAVEGQPIHTTDEFSTLMKSWAGMGVNITVETGQVLPLFEGLVEQGKQQRIVNLIPRANPPEGEGAVGVGIYSYPYIETKGIQDLSLGQWAARSVRQAVESTGIWIGRIWEGLRQIGTSLVQGKTPEGVSGPVGIYQLTGIVASEGFLPLLELVAILSVNLAVFNILPIPALDGGRAFFIYLEAIRKKRIKPETEQKINGWGMAFLLGLMVLISLQDVIRLGVLNKLGIK